MAASIREVVDRAQQILGEVQGAGVQTYGEDRMFADTITIFDLLFKKYFWPQFMTWQTLTLDGTTGRVTLATAFNYLKDFEDIVAVFPEGSSTAMARLETRKNPFLWTGTRAMRWGSIHASDAAYLGKRLQFYPVTAVGSVVVGARLYPLTQESAAPESEWDWDDIMELDKDMLAHGVAWLMLSSDELNAENAAAQQGLMEGRFNDITNNFAGQGVHISGDSGVPMDWHVTP